MTRELPGQACEFVSLRDDATIGAALPRMPYASRVFAENLLRKGGSREALAALAAGRRDLDFPWFPGRVLLQDLTGTPALVDLAGLRYAVSEAGGDPAAVDPRVPVDFVVDHSLKVLVDGSRPEALALNRAEEDRQNAERFAFLDWCAGSFRNFRLLPRGKGICHQYNLESLATVVSLEDGLAFPDTLIGTDSHTPMINALGVLAWGVGGIEAESVILGRPVFAPLPELVRVELSGSPRHGSTAADLALALTEFFRKEGVVGSVLEFHGPGSRILGVPDRATIANMAPEYGASSALFPVDEATLSYLATTGRPPALVGLVEAYAKAQGLWRGDFEEAAYHRVLRFDLSAAGRAIAGPANPHDRIELGRLAEKGIARSSERSAERSGDRASSSDRAAADAMPADLPLVIAAIAACTNTANPRSVIGAALLARKALARGLRRKSWVKASFTPGSTAVAAYLESADLLAPLAELGFGIAGYGCATCNGMSGPLLAGVEEEIARRGSAAAAIVSGNRNFNGRIHPAVARSFIASPALVVAWSLAGSMAIDLGLEPIGRDRQGRPVLLDEIWPTDEEIDEIVAEKLGPSCFSEMSSICSTSGSRGEAAASPLFAWDERSNYIRRPPYWESALVSPSPLRGLRPLAILGDNVTTDDLSPSGAILERSAAGRYLVSRGVPAADFNSYGTRRGDHLVAERATLANNRLRNEMAGGREGSLSRREPDGEVGEFYGIAVDYRREGRETLIIAGRNYGSGSSRDWAAKGVRLLGVRAVLAESFERIHRSNLVGMGVLPLEFERGVTRKSLGLDGGETYSILVEGRVPEPRARLVLEIARRDGGSTRTTVLCRIDTEEEARTFAAGGLLPLVRDELLRGRGKRGGE